MDKWINDFGYELLDGVFMDETMSVYEDPSLKQLYFDSISYIRNGLVDIGRPKVLILLTVREIRQFLTKDLNSQKVVKMHSLLEMLVKQLLLISSKPLTQASLKKSCKSIDLMPV